MHLFCTRRLYLFSRNNVAFPQEVISISPGSHISFPQEVISHFLRNSYLISPGSHISIPRKSFLFAILHDNKQQVSLFEQLVLPCTSRRNFFCYFLYEWLACSPSSVYASGWQDFQIHRNCSL